MASSQFEHPKIDWEALNLYQEFERFKSHVMFVFDGPLSELTAKQRAGWLGTWLGEQGREIYKTLNWADGGKKRILPRYWISLQATIRPRKNKRIARLRFKQRKQGSSESFDNFVKDLRLTLMDSPNKKMYNKGQMKPIYQKQASVNQQKSCTSCGKDTGHKWNKGKCPAKGSVCSSCHKPNHWAAVCRKRAISTVSVEPSQDSPDDEILDISLTQTDDAAEDKWTVTLEILSQEVKFRIDTGSKCNTLTLDKYQLLMHTAYDPLKVKQLLDKTKDTQKFYHDHKRAGNPPVVLKPGDEVRMQPYPGSHKWSPGVVVKPHSAPRSYVVDCGNKEYRRSSQHLCKSTAAANHPRHWIRQEPWTETSDCKRWFHRAVMELNHEEDDGLKETRRTRDFTSRAVVSSGPDIFYEVLQHN
ncbi:hypothetical protein ABVT39_014186 [Epinephelus coioides]